MQEIILDVKPAYRHWKGTQVYEYTVTNSLSPDKNDVIVFYSSVKVEKGQSVIVYFKQLRGVLTINIYPLGEEVKKDA